MYDQVNGEHLSTGRYWQWESYFISKLDANYYRLARVKFVGSDMILTLVDVFMSLADALQAAKSDKAKQSEPIS